MHLEQVDIVFVDRHQDNQEKAFGRIAEIEVRVLDTRKADVVLSQGFEDVEGIEQEMNREKNTRELLYVQEFPRG
jgi:hypothetical protein